MNVEMDVESRPVLQGIEVGFKPLFVLTLGEVALARYAQTMDPLAMEAPPPSERALSVLDAVTCNCATPVGLERFLSERKTGTVSNVLEARSQLNEAKEAYGATTIEHAAHISLVRGDIPLRPRGPMPRPPTEVEQTLEDVVSGMTMSEIADRYALSESAVRDRYVALMAFYGNARNLPTAVRRAHEVGHWPAAMSLPAHTIAGIAMAGSVDKPLSTVQLEAVKDRSEGLGNAESALIRETREDVQKTRMRAAFRIFGALSTSELITKAVVTGALHIEHTVPGKLLTVQERVVGCGVALGLSNVEIGKQCFVVEDTIKRYMRKIFQKLGATSREQVARRLFEDQYLVPSSMPPRVRIKPYTFPEAWISSI